MKRLMAPLGLLFCLVAGVAQADEVFRPVTTYNLQVASTSAAITSAIQAQTFAVRIVSTVAAHFTMGVAPQTATTDMTYLAANVPEVFAIRGGEYIAAIRVSSDGNIYITELTK